MNPPQCPLPSLLPDAKPRASPSVASGVTTGQYSNAIAVSFYFFRYINSTWHPRIHAGTQSVTAFFISLPLSIFLTIIPIFPSNGMWIQNNFYKKFANPEIIPNFAFPNDGAVAQMVEQWTENPCVGSSILPSTTNKRRKPFDNKSVCGFSFEKLSTNRQRNRELKKSRPPKRTGTTSNAHSIFIIERTKVQIISQKQ